ncbi:MAG TPA: BTAD domain-containing putative transcriptional regulator [Longimicrobium sp.]
MITLKVLGDPVLTGPGGPVTGRAAYKRRIALLSILAVARGRPVGRERVIALLWPEHASDAARHTLSESLSVLRRELGDGVFVSFGDEVSLSPEVVGSDVGAFEEALAAGRLEEAVGHYGGPLLDGFYVSNAPEFERWVDTERDRLARACSGALERLASASEEDGRTLEAVEWWRRLAAHDPYGSRVALRLAQALEAAGERAGALLAAEAHAARVREELGVEPDAAFTAFMEGLRTAPPRPLSAARTVAEPADADFAGDAAPSAEADLLGGGIAPGDPDSPVEVRPTAPPPMVDAVTAPAAVRPDAAAMRSASTLAAAPGAAAGRGRRMRRWAAAAVLGGALAAGGALLLPERGTDAPEPPRYDPRRIAVLYFEDDSPGGELGYLARGLTGELIDELSQVSALDVVSRGAVRAYRDGGVSFDSLVAGLRVGSVVEGSVQRYGDSVRVTVQLVDTNRRSHLESRTIVRAMGDLFSLESALAEEVGGFLRRRLGQEVRLREAAAETRSSRARDLVLRAEHARDDAAILGRREHPLDGASALRRLARADSLLAAAEAADPAWTRPVVQRGFVALARVGLSPISARPPLLAAAAGHADRALARQPRNALALELRGRAHWQAAMEGHDTANAVRRLDAAEHDLRAALDADSTLATGWAALSHLLRFRGRFAESDLAARRALAQDAYLEDADGILQRLYFGAMAQGDYPEARELCGRGHAQFPGAWQFVECQLTLMREDPSQVPDPARAWALVAELDRLDPAPRAQEEGRRYSPLYRRAAVAAVLARAGAADSARAVLARARQQAGSTPELHLPLLLDEAYVTLLLGDRAGARRLVDAYLAQSPEMRPNLSRDILFRDLLAPAAAPSPPRTDTRKR